MRDELIMSYMPLVRSLARNINERLPPNVDYDDLVSYGTFGMIEAVDKFDPEFGVKFETFATKRIQGAIYDGLRAMEWTPRTIYTQVREFENASQLLTTSLQRKPTETELAEKLGWDNELVSEVRSKSGVKGIRSLEERHGEDEWSLGDSLTDLDSTPRRMEMGELGEDMSSAVSSLGEKERVVLALYYFEGLHFSEIGELLKVSESRVCQIHMQAIESIRSFLE